MLIMPYEGSKTLLTEMLFIIITRIRVSGWLRYLNYHQVIVEFKDMFIYFETSMLSPHPRSCFPTKNHIFKMFPKFFFFFFGFHPVLGACIGSLTKFKSHFAGLIWGWSSYWIFSIPRARELWLRVEQSHHCTTTHKCSLQYCFDNTFTCSN